MIREPELPMARPKAIVPPLTLILDREMLRTFSVMLTTTEKASFVIVMTFWYVFWNELTFFELFKLLFSLGIDHDPPCFL